MKKRSAFYAVALAIAAMYFWKAFTMQDDGQGTRQPSGRETVQAEVTLTFPADQYPETAAHMKEAIAGGKSAICTIDRDGADANRQEALKDVPVKEGFDRDEWPMAMCAEGGAGADVEYVKQGDNRGAGAWISNQLEAYEDGTQVRFIVE
ncbi:NucA/NucB deoxyribonuclease domain-containing protein [Paenibacillus methanolicus]|uniref:Deoxyribonuclease NucA/NucB n=1 Tax=Paenibacillus methanolicus TaxID=582686 RepID=A0A5S5CHL1_9BACL|nr:deoxyribonuclease NucA/NucB [Paenibacillus methanolicus]